MRYLKLGLLLGLCHFSVLASKHCEPVLKTNAEKFSQNQLVLLAEVQETQILCPTAQQQGDICAEGPIVTLLKPITVFKSPTAINDETLYLVQKNDQRDHKFTNGEWKIIFAQHVLGEMYKMDKCIQGSPLKSDSTLVETFKTLSKSAL